MQDHNHSHEVSNEKNILLAFFLNVGFAAIEFVGGYFTNSVAIYSDALHDLGDGLTLLFSYFAEKISSKKADDQFTFGYRRFSVLAALVNGIILIVGSTFIIREAITRFQNPEPIHAKGVILLSLLGLAVNGFAAYRMSKNTGANSRMIMFHLLEDVLGWCAVLIVSIVLIFKPWYFLDSVLSILIALIIINGVIKNLYKVSAIFLQAFPSKLNREKLVNEISAFKNVLGVHFIQGWSLDDTYFNLTFHVKVSSELQMKEVDNLRMEIEHFLRSKKIAYTTIQFEGNECSTENMKAH